MPCDDDCKEESKGLNVLNIAGRIVAMALAVASAAFMATASECTIFFPYSAPVHTITYSEFSPFVYLVVANALAALMLGVAIFLSVWKKGGHKCSKVILPLLDAATPALLYSATGAAFAAKEYMSYCAPQGRRVNICDGAAGRGTGNFCSQVHIAIYISLAAAVTASVAEMLKNVKLPLGGGCDSDSDCGCGHGCHKH